MRRDRTTTCCSVLALILVCSAWCAARASGQHALAPGSHRSAKPDRTPLSLFPLHTVWTLALNSQIAAAAAPVFDSAHGFFPIEGDRIVAYDLGRGEQVWIAASAAAIEPAASRDLLFVVEARRLAALRVADGSRAWELALAEPPAARPVFDNGWLIISTIQGDVLAFRAADGTLVWRKAVGSPAHAPPALAADRVYVSTEDGRVVALRVDSGATVWEHRLGGAPSDILALDDRLFVGSKDNFFYSLKTDSGDPDWLWRTGGDAIGLPVVDERAVYFVSLDNVLWALNRSNGNQRWKRALPLRPTGGPVRAGQTLVIPGFAAKLPAYKMDDGSPAGDVPMAGEIAAPPHVVAGANVFASVLYVTTRDIIKGATVTALSRSIEPALAPVEVLPNPVTFTPAAKAATPR